MKQLPWLLLAVCHSVGCGTNSGSWLRYYHIPKPELLHVLSTGSADITNVADCGDRLFLLANGGRLLQCHDVKKGLQWQITSDGPATSGALTLRGDFLYYVASDGKLRKVDCRTGDVAWNINVPTPDADFKARSSPILNGRHLIVSGGTSGWLHWFDESDGSLIRTVKWPKPLESGPVLHHDRLFVSDRNGTLRCLNAHTGDVLWEEKLNREVGELCVSGDSLYFQTPDLFKYSLTGRQVWRVYFDFMGQVCVRNGRVYISDLGKIVIFDAQEGVYCDILYLNPCTHSGDLETGASICRAFDELQTGMAVVNQDGGIYGVNADFMEHQWTIAIDVKHGKKVVWASVHRMGRILVATEKGTVLILEIAPKAVDDKEKAKDRW